MTTTNHHLEHAVFGGKEELEKAMQQLLLAASKAAKYHGKKSKTLFGLGESKSEKYTNETVQLLSYIGSLLGGLDPLRKTVDLTKQVYPNWQDAYFVIDAITTVRYNSC